MKEIRLELLGLTKYEASAYEALVRLGKAGAPEISRESGVPYGRIYDTLNSLVNKGLVIVIPEKAKKFIAAPPESIEKILNTKIREMLNLKEDIKKLKTIYTTTEEPVEIARGKRNFYKVIKRVPRPEKYSYSIRFTSEIRPEWVNDNRKEIKKGVDLKRLVKYDENTKENIIKWKKLIPGLKQRKFEINNVAADIVDDKAVFFALIESNVTILVKDPNFAKLMRKLYELAWEKSENI